MKLEEFSHTFIEAGELTKMYMQILWNLADQSQIFGAESVLTTEFKHKFQKINEINEELLQNRAKGLQFYSSHLMELVKQIHKLN